MKAIILYLLSSMEPQAIFVGGEEALIACGDTALTYEVAVACIPVASENLPYVIREPRDVVRPKPNPNY